MRFRAVYRGAGVTEVTQVQRQHPPRQNTRNRTTRRRTLRAGGGRHAPPRTRWRMLRRRGWRKDRRGTKRFAPLRRPDFGSPREAREAVAFRSMRSSRQRSQGCRFRDVVCLLAAWKQLICACDRPRIASPACRGGWLVNPQGVEERYEHAEMGRPRDGPMSMLGCQLRPSNSLSEGTM